MIKHTKYLLAFFISLSTLAGAQVSTHLECHGKIPAEFTTPSQEKAKIAIANDSILHDKFSLSRRQQREFFVQSSYAIDRLLKSGKVLFNDSISMYVNSVLDEILKNDKNLRQELRLYVVKSPYVNAFATGNGIIFINIGLLAQLENEAQLAFILCHEIAHYTNKHSLDGFKEQIEIEKGKGDYRAQSVEDKLLSQSNFSKMQELDADETGFNRYLKTGYAPLEADEVFFVLKFAHLPFDEIEFENNFIANKYYPLKDDVLLSELTPVSFDDEDDKYSTHPNISTRRMQLAPVLNANKKDGKEYLVSETQFKKLQKKARYEMTSLFLSSQRYASALYNAFLLEKIYPGNAENEIFKTEAMIGLSEYKNAYELDEVCTYYQDLEGQSQQLNHIVLRLTSLDMNIYAVYNAFAGLKKFENNKYLKKLCINAMVNLIADHNVNLFDFKKMVETPVDSTEDATEVKDEPKNKYDKLKSEATLKESKPYIFAFSEYIEDPLFVKLFQRATKRNLKKTEYLKLAQKDRDTSLNLQKIIMTQPYYIKVTNKSEEGFLIEKSEQAMLQVLDLLPEMAEATAVNLDMMTPLLMESDDVERFNDYSTIKEWLIETAYKDTLNIPSSHQPEIEAIMEKYGTRYVGYTSFFTLKHRKANQIIRSTILGGVMALATQVPATGVPFLLYGIARPSTTTYCLFSVYDMETNQKIKTFFYEYQMSDRKFVIKSTLFNSIFKLKKK
ncbi:M48 family metalloprotease [bacterium]|nr:M48 family metalloprotease [bacterium]